MLGITTLLYSNFVLRFLRSVKSIFRRDDIKNKGAQKEVKFCLIIEEQKNTDKNG